MTIANVFVDSQDDVRLILLLMYKTIIIIVRRPIIIGAIKLPRYFTSVPHFTHTCKWGIKYTSAVRAPSLLRHFRHQEGSRTVASECRQFFETAQVKLVVLCMCRARQSALFCGWVYFECWADAAVRETERNGTRKVKYTRDYRLLLLIGNVLKTDSKTKPTSKLNCRVIIFIYKLGCQECKKRHLLDIFLNSFELWMNMTKLHRQHFVFFTAH